MIFFRKKIRKLNTQEKKVYMKTTKLNRSFNFAVVLVLQKFCFFVLLSICEHKKIFFLVGIDSEKNMERVAQNKSPIKKN